jgi:poly-gamma-glutamate synthesis protein (capsule biosynthesis protein)
VNLHWGEEKADTPDRDQREFAHAVIDAGADVIIGHHPHVLQGIERYKSGVIVYSLGNFLFGGNSRDTYDTALFEVRLMEKNNASYRLIPIRIDRWQARELKGAECEKVLRHVERLSRIFPESIFMNKEAR